MDINDPKYFSIWTQPYPQSRHKSREEQLVETVEQLKAKLKEQDDAFKELLKGPSIDATVLKSNKERVTIASAMGTLQVPNIKKVDFSVGDTIRVEARTMAIAEIIEPMPLGEVCRVRSVKETTAEIDRGGMVTTILVGKHKPKTGHRIIIDRTGSIIVGDLGPAEDKYDLDAVTGVSWGDIGGAEDAKQALREAIELPVKYPDIFRKYGKRPSRGVLLYGPPGCGKTLLAKAAATSLAATHGHNTARGFIYVKGPEILNKWVGESESNVRALFDRARQHKEKHGYPAIIFIDEADALLNKRGEEGRSMQATIVPMFLSEMDGLDDAAAFVLLATNRPDSLDPAVVRDGRIDRKIMVPRPTKITAPAIFELNLKNKPAVKGLAETATDELFSEHRVFGKLNKDGKKIGFGLHHIVNGAMIAGIVDKAATLAMHREIEKIDTKGITRVDIVSAIDETFMQEKHVDHKSDIEDFIATMEM